MKTKLHLIKSILIILLGGLAATGISRAVQAEICPLVETIVSSNPDSADYATYLSAAPPGWHSHRVPMVDLSNAKFDSVLANYERVDCVYDTPSGYLVLQPDYPFRTIDFNAIANNNRWYCNASQSEIYPDRTEQDCTCTDSIDTCGFSLVSAGTYSPYYTPYYIP